MIQTMACITLTDLFTGEIPVCTSQGHRTLLAVKRSCVQNMPGARLLHFSILTARHFIEATGKGGKKLIFLMKFKLMAPQK